MPQPKATVENIIRLAQALSPLEKLEVIERLAPDLEPALCASAGESVPKSRRGLRGMLKGADIKDDDIQQARREMWGGFPRGDL